MADISMCAGTDCPRKEQCHRHTARWTEHWQSLFVNPPLDKKTGKCSYFCDNEGNIDNKDFRNSWTMREKGSAT